MYSSSEIERLWADAYKKALSRGYSPQKARERADYAAAEARAHGAEGNFRRPGRNRKVEKILEEQKRRAKLAEEARESAPEISATDLRKQLLERNKAYARNWAKNLDYVTPMSRLRLQKDMLNSLNKRTEQSLKAMAEKPAIPFERYLAHQEISNKVAEALAKRFAGPTQWKNWTPGQRQDAIETARYWDERVRQVEGGWDPEYEMREMSAEVEEARRLSEASLHKRESWTKRWSMMEAGEFGRGEPAPIERTPYMSAKEMDRAIFRESVKSTGAKLGAAGLATGAALKGGAKKVAGWGGRALARLGSSVVAGPAGLIAMGAMTGWDVGSMMYDTAKEGEAKMGSAKWPMAIAGINALAELGNMLADSGVAERIKSYGYGEQSVSPLDFPDEFYRWGNPLADDTPIGFGPLNDWNDIADTVLGNITGQGVEGEPNQQTANEIVETWARAYEGEVKKEMKEDYSSVASASPGDWFGGQGWSWANQLAQDKPAQAIAEAFDPWTEFNPRDQSNLEAHGADIGRGLGGSADEELKELMAQTTFLQKIADNTKEDEIAVLGV